MGRIKMLGSCQVHNTHSEAQSYGNPGLRDSKLLEVLQAEKVTNFKGIRRLNFLHLPDIQCYECITGSGHYAGDQAFPGPFQAKWVYKAGGGCIDHRSGFDGCYT